MVNTQSTHPLELEIYKDIGRTEILVNDSSNNVLELSYQGGDGFSCISEPVTIYLVAEDEEHDSTNLHILEPEIALYGGELIETSLVELDTATKAKQLTGVDLLISSPIHRKLWSYTFKVKKTNDKRRDYQLFIKVSEVNLTADVEPKQQFSTSRLVMLDFPVNFSRVQPSAGSGTTQHFINITNPRQLYIDVRQDIEQIVKGVSKDDIIGSQSPGDCLNCLDEYKIQVKLNKEIYPYFFDEDCEKFLFNYKRTESISYEDLDNFNSYLITNDIGINLLTYRIVCIETNEVVQDTNNVDIEKLVVIQFNPVIHLEESNVMICSQKYDSSGNLLACSGEIIEYYYDETGNNDVLTTKQNYKYNQHINHLVWHQGYKPGGSSVENDYVKSMNPHTVEKYFTDNNIINVKVTSYDILLNGDCYDLVQCGPGNIITYHEFKTKTYLENINDCSNSPVLKVELEINPNVCNTHIWDKFECKYVPIEMGVSDTSLRVKYDTMMTAINNYNEREKLYNDHLEVVDNSEIQFLKYDGSGSEITNAVKDMEQKYDSLFNLFDTYKIYFNELQTYNELSISYEEIETNLELRAIDASNSLSIVGISYENAQNLLDEYKNDLYDFIDASSVDGLIDGINNLIDTDLSGITLDELTNHAISIQDVLHKNITVHENIYDMFEVLNNYNRALSKLDSLQLDISGIDVGVNAIYDGSMVLIQERIQELRTNLNTRINTTLQLTSTIMGTDLSLNGELNGDYELNGTLEATDLLSDLELTVTISQDTATINVINRTIVNGPSGETIRNVFDEMNVFLASTITLSGEQIEVLTSNNILEDISYSFTEFMSAIDASGEILITNALFQNVGITGVLSQTFDTSFNEWIVNFEETASELYDTVSKYNDLSNNLAIKEYYVSLLSDITTELTNTRNSYDSALSDISLSIVNLKQEFENLVDLQINRATQDSFDDFNSKKDDLLEKFKEEKSKQQLYLNSLMDFLYVSKDYFDAKSLYEALDKTHSLSEYYSQLYRDLYDTFVNRESETSTLISNTINDLITCNTIFVGLLDTTEAYTPQPSSLFEENTDSFIKSDGSITWVSDINLQNILDSKQSVTQWLEQVENKRSIKDNDITLLSDYESKKDVTEGIMVESINNHTDLFNSLKNNGFYNISTSLWDNTQFNVDSRYILFRQNKDTRNLSLKYETVQGSTILDTNNSLLIDDLQTNQETRNVNVIYKSDSNEIPEHMYTLSHEVLSSLTKYPQGSMKRDETKVILVEQPDGNQLQFNNCYPHEFIIKLEAIEAIENICTLKDLVTTTGRIYGSMTDTELFNIELGYKVTNVNVTPRLFFNRADSNNFDEETETTIINITKDPSDPTRNYIDPMTIQNLFYKGNENTFLNKKHVGVRYRDPVMGEYLHDDDFFQNSVYVDYVQMITGKVGKYNSQGSEVIQPDVETTYLLLNGGTHTNSSHVSPNNRILLKDYLLTMDKFPNGCIPNDLLGFNVELHYNTLAVDDHSVPVGSGSKTSVFEFYHINECYRIRPPTVEWTRIPTYLPVTIEFKVDQLQFVPHKEQLLTNNLRHNPNFHNTGVGTGTPNPENITDQTADEFTQKDTLYVTPRVPEGDGYTTNSWINTRVQHDNGMDKALYEGDLEQSFITNYGNSFVINQTTRSLSGTNRTNGMIGNYGANIGAHPSEARNLLRQEYVFDGTTCFQITNTDNKVMVFDLNRSAQDPLFRYELGDVTDPDRLRHARTATIEMQHSIKYVDYQGFSHPRYAPANNDEVIEDETIGAGAIIDVNSIPNKVLDPPCNEEDRYSLHKTFKWNLVLDEIKDPTLHMDSIPFTLMNDQGAEIKRPFWMQGQEFTDWVKHAYERKNEQDITEVEVEPLNSELHENALGNPPPVDGANNLNDALDHPDIPDKHMYIDNKGEFHHQYGERAWIERAEWVSGEKDLPQFEVGNSYDVVLRNGIFDITLDSNGTPGTTNHPQNKGGDYSILKPVRDSYKLNQSTEDRDLNVWTIKVVSVDDSGNHIVTIQNKSQEQYAFDSNLTRYFETVYDADGVSYETIPILNKVKTESGTLLSENRFNWILTPIQGGYTITNSDTGNRHINIIQDANGEQHVVLSDNAPSNPWIFGDINKGVFGDRIVLYGYGYNTVGMDASNNVDTGVLLCEQEAPVFEGLTQCISDVSYETMQNNLSNETELLNQLRTLYPDLKVTYWDAHAYWSVHSYTDGVDQEAGDFHDPNDVEANAVGLTDDVNNHEPIDFAELTNNPREDVYQHDQTFAIDMEGDFTFTYKETNNSTSYLQVTTTFANIGTALSGINHSQVSVVRIPLVKVDAPEDGYVCKTTRVVLEIGVQDNVEPIVVLLESVDNTFYLADRLNGDSNLLSEKIEVLHSRYVFEFAHLVEEGYVWDKLRHNGTQHNLTIRDLLAPRPLSFSVSASQLSGSSVARLRTTNSLTLETELTSEDGSVNCCATMYQDEYLTSLSFVSERTIDGEEVKLTPAVDLEYDPVYNGEVFEGSLTLADYTSSNLLREFTGLTGETYKLFMTDSTHQLNCGELNGDGVVGEDDGELLMVHNSETLWNLNGSLTARQRPVVVSTYNKQTNHKLTSLRVLERDVDLSYPSCGSVSVSTRVIMPSKMPEGCRVSTVSCSHLPFKSILEDRLIDVDCSCGLIEGNVTDELPITLDDADRLAKLTLDCSSADLEDGIIDPVLYARMSGILAQNNGNTDGLHFNVTSSSGCLYERYAEYDVNSATRLECTDLGNNLTVAKHPTVPQPTVSEFELVNHVIQQTNQGVTGNLQLGGAVSVASIITLNTGIVDEALYRETYCTTIFPGTYNWECADEKTRTITLTECSVPELSFKSWTDESSKTQDIVLVINDDHFTDVSWVDHLSVKWDIPDGLKLDSDENNNMKVLIREITVNGTNHYHSNIKDLHLIYDTKQSINDVIQNSSLLDDENDLVELVNNELEAGNAETLNINAYNGENIVVSYIAIGFLGGNMVVSDIKSISFTVSETA